MTTRPPRPFLLTETGDVESSWLNDWPQGGVALVVGGSVDMRSVRKRVKEALKGKEIDIYMVHATLWGGRFRPRGKYLLLATETLFSQKFKAIRNRLWVVFDMCEKHEMLQPSPTSDQMNWLKQFGRCDALLTVSISPEDFARRRGLLGRAYRPKMEVLVLDPLLSAWQLSINEIWSKAGRLPFVGIQLPDVYPNDLFWDYLFGWSTERSHFNAKEGGDFLSFNSLPLNFLLEETVAPCRSPKDRIALSLLVCAVQLVSSRGFAPIFQHKRALTFDPDTVWYVTETSVWMELFLSAAGKWSKEATLTYMALQWKQGVPIVKLRNLEDHTFTYYFEGFNERHQTERLSERFISLLEEMMWLMLEFQGQLMVHLQHWCGKYEITAAFSNSWPEAWRSVGYFLETTIRDAAIAANNVYVTPSFEFVFPIGSLCELRRSRLQRATESCVYVAPEKCTQALQTVWWWHFRSQYRVEPDGSAKFRCGPGSCQEDRLLASVMFLNLLLDHDEDLDEQEKRSWQLHTPDSRECPEKLFIFMTGRNGSVQFATVPLKFYGADAKTFFEGKSIYVLKRFATPDLLVLKSCLLCEPPTLAIDGDSTPRYALTSA